MTSLPPPNLTQAEIDDICHPLRQGAAQVRYLASLGLTVRVRPNGKPLVGRDHAAAVLGSPVAAGNDSEGPIWTR